MNTYLIRILWRRMLPLFLVFLSPALTGGFLPANGVTPRLQKIDARCREKRFAVSRAAPCASDLAYRVALWMGGARVGKEVGEHLMEAGLTGDEAIRRVINFMEYCKVGKINSDETIRIWENCESFGLETGQPSCNFTTFFLNGLFSAVKNKHVREVKCIAARAPYCEWEIE